LRSFSAILNIMSIFSGKYKNLITLVCLCIISLILSWSYVPDHNVETLTKPGNNTVKNALTLFIVPNQLIERGVSYIADELSGAWYYMVGVFQKPVKEEEFEALQSSIESLNLQLDEERSKNRSLEQLWRFSRGLTEVKPAFRFVPARVTAVDPTDWFRYVTIDKGRNHGISVDMAVITQVMYPPPKSMTTTKLMTGVVVGKVSSIQANSAIVQLVTDRLSVVAVTIGPQKNLALLKGRPEYEDCTIEEVPSTTHDMLSVGDPVTVDERSSIFPPGMLIGWITAIDKRIQFCHIEVQPAFKFSRLKDVLVVLNSGY